MIRKLDNFLDLIAKWGVLVCIGLMLVLSLTNITLRWFENSVLWIEPLVRHLVFLAAFFGGAIATGEGQHIKIDLLSKILERTDNKLAQVIVERIVLLACLLATLILTKAGYDLVLVEKEYGGEAFLGIHSAYLIAIIPFGMGFISLRFFLNLFLKPKVREVEPI